MLCNVTSGHVISLLSAAVSQMSSKLRLKTVSDGLSSTVRGSWVLTLVILKFTTVHILKFMELAVKLRNIQYLF